MMALNVWLVLMSLNLKDDRDSMRSMKAAMIQVLKSVAADRCTVVFVCKVAIQCAGEAKRSMPRAHISKSQQPVYGT